MKKLLLSLVVISNLYSSERAFDLARFVSYAPFLISCAISIPQEKAYQQAILIGVGFGASQLTNKAIADRRKKIINHDMILTVPTAKDNPFKIMRILKQQKKLQKIEANRELDIVMLSIGFIAAQAFICKSALSQRA